MLLHKKKGEDLLKLWPEHKNYTPSLPMKKRAERTFSMEGVKMCKDYLNIFIDTNLYAKVVDEAISNIYRCYRFVLHDFNDHEL